VSWSFGHRVQFALMVPCQRQRVRGDGDQPRLPMVLNFPGAVAGASARPHMACGEPFPVANVMAPSSHLVWRGDWKKRASSTRSLEEERARGVSGR
jgi:hypothetical protein